MALYSVSACASLSFRNFSLSFKNPTHHRFGFLSTTFASPLRTSSRACNFSHQRSATAIIGRRVSCSLLKVEEDINDEACELVSGIELSVGEGVDSINAHLFKAVKNNNGSGILLLSDIFGFEDSSTREFAYRVACNGYNVLLPDLFRGDPWITKEKPEILFDEWIVKQEPQRVAKDIATSTKWMIDEFLAAGISKKLGLVGFCFGGGKVIDVLARDQGDNDPLCSVNVLENIEKSIGRGSRLVTFKGRGHGFAHRPESADDDEDAEKAFMIMRNWLNEGMVAVTE